MRYWRTLVALGIALVLLVVFFPGNSLGATSQGPAAHPAANHFSPVGGLDCNGYSPIQKLPRYLNCIDPTGPNGHFLDNGWYIGHDEPGMRFISNTPGSGNSFTYLLQLPRNGSSAAPGLGYPTYSMTPTFWIGLPLCDPNSYPQNPCTPDSDHNTGLGNSPHDAGSAVLELQFYPPGFPDYTGCFNGPHTQLGTHWCAALNIDSAECTFEFAFCNPNCTEPVNFAFLTRDGIPVAPPSPQDSNANTFVGNQTPIFRMNSGDMLRIDIHDTSHGLFTGVTDLTNGMSGFMVASGANGFMNTNLFTCAGTPFNFHPEYASAAAANIVPWAADQAGNLFVTEIGHYEYADGNADKGYPGGNDDVACLPNPAGTTICAGTDFDFDGRSYQPATWPMGTTATGVRAGPINILPVVSGVPGPATFVHGVGFVASTVIELETDVGFTLNRQPTGTPTCNIDAPGFCSVDRIASEIPTYRGFYPFWSMQGCVAYFGNVTGAGIDSFGGIAGYGPNVADYPGPSAVWAENGAFYPNVCR